MGHEDVICRAKIQQVAVEVENAQQEEEDYLFVATCFSSNVINTCIVSCLFPRLHMLNTVYLHC